MNKYNRIIGIDPDVTTSGVAILDVRAKQIKVTNLTFTELLEFFSWEKEAEAQLGKSLFVIEAGWLIKHVWQVKKGDNSKLGAAKAKAVGRNNETGKKIEELCKHYGLDCKLQTPLKKIWKGPDGKITHEEFKQITGYQGRTNQDNRDAGLIAWNESGLIMRVKV